MPDAVWSQYVVVETNMNWNDANAYCASTYGTTLATITSDDDAEALLAIKKDAWIGLNDLAQEGTWVWTSGHECDGNCANLDYWTGSGPSNSYNNEHCAKMDP